MKIKLYLGILVGLFTTAFSISYAQSPPCYNTSCASALRVCYIMNQDFDFNTGNATSCGNTSLYYIVQFAGTGPGLQVNLINATGTWETYGPFNTSALTNCELVDSYLNLISSGDFSSSACTISSINNKFYIVKVKPQTCSGTVQFIPSQGARMYCDDQIHCDDCISSFAPSPGKYIVSA